MKKNKKLFPKESQFAWDSIDNYIASCVPGALFHEGQIVQFKRSYDWKKQYKSNWYLVIGYHLKSKLGTGRHLVLRKLGQDANGLENMLDFWVKESDLELVEP